MSRVIRVDAEVFEKLQKLAVPLVDTPNDVLRRLLELDVKEKQMNAVQARSRSDSGRRINERYQMNAEHALYHIDGTFYERLERFPAFLADPNGYVWYGTERDFVNDENLDIQEKVHVPRQLCHHPRYVRFPN